MEILQETNQYLVINKPAGLMVHPDGKRNEKTLVDVLLEHYPEIEKIGEPLILQDGTTLYRPGIVHRLDRETSGVLIIAKTNEMFQSLKQQFKERTIKKCYRALVWGAFAHQRGSIDEPLGRSKTDFRKWTVARGARGKIRQAKTTYRVLSSGVVDGKPYSYLEIYPETGRTHQIRVHLKYIQHPIMCDMRYGFPAYPCPLQRLALHAFRLTFKTLEDETVTVEAPIPNSFTKLLSVEN